MISNRLKILRKKINSLNIDGYVIPKNDEFFSEYSQKDRLKIISNFTGSAGYAVILKNQNYLFVDGRYTIQAHLESGKHFKIEGLDKISNCKLFKNLTLGIDPKIFTSENIKKFFLKFNKVKIIDSNLIDEIFNRYPKNTRGFYSLKTDVVGESYIRKIKKVSKILKEIESDYLFVSAPENVAWLLNIRGYDNPNSPIPNCRLLLTKNNKFYLICNEPKAKKLIKEKKISKKQIINPKKFKILVNQLKVGRIIIDNKTCSLFLEELLKKKLKILKNEDPIYLLKSLKNITEINNMINSHIIDGAALTKFLYWIKIKNRKRITEIDAQKKLEFFRKKDKRYMFPSFNTLAS